MCIQDYAITRRSATAFSQVSVPSANSVQLFPQNPSRIAVLIGSDLANNLFIGPNGFVSAVKGILVAAKALPLRLQLVDFGNLVTGELWGQMDAGTGAITIVETSIDIPFEVLIREWQSLVGG